MKKIILISILFLTFGFNYAQTESSKTILFLLPINAHGLAQTNIESLNEAADIENHFNNSLIGFWEGAQIALNEIAQNGRMLNVITRDITNDSNKLESILAEVANKKIDLIIAPVYGKMFPKVAAFAKNHKIPVINPFSSRHDIVEENPYVYKLIPDLSVRPQMVNETYPNSNYILWINENDFAHEVAAYENYFRSHNIVYHKTVDTADISKLFSEHLRNVVISCYSNPIRVSQTMTKMLNYSEKNFQWIVPESWFKIKNLNIENANTFKLCYFTNYFVDAAEELTTVFTYNYARKYESLPTIDNFAFQGYDVTKFFVNLICNDYNLLGNEDLPLSCRFKFKRAEKGGYENTQTRLIQIDNYKYIEIK